MRLLLARAVRAFARLWMWSARFAVLGASVSGCVLADEAPLLRLSGIDPRELSVGEPLRLRGEGFPTGATCRVRLRGQWVQPGERAQDVVAELAAHAVSEDEIAAPLVGDRFDAIALHASFVGDLSVVFVAAAGASRVSGQLPRVSFDVTSNRADVALRDALERRAQQALAQVGLVLEDDAVGEGGLRVAWATEGGAADRAQLKQGDLLSHRDGLRLRALTDLAPPIGAQQIQLRVQPSDGAALRTVSLTLSSAQSPTLSSLSVAASVVAGLMLVCIAWLAPRPRRLVRFPARSSEHGVPASWPVSASARAYWPLMLLWTLTCALLWVTLAASHHAPLGAHLPGVLALVALTHGAVSTVRRLRTRPLPETVRTLSSLVWLALSMVCALLVAGSVTWVGSVEQQGAWPWQWFMFKAPPLWLAAIAYFGASHQWLSAWQTARPIDRALLAALLSGLGVALFMGGWQPLGHWHLGAIDPRSLGLLMFGVKAWLVWLALAVPTQRVVARSAWMSWALSLTSVVLSIAWLRMALTPALELALGYTLCGATVAVWLVRQWRAPRALSAGEVA